MRTVVSALALLVLVCAAAFAEDRPERTLAEHIVISPVIATGKIVKATGEFKEGDTTCTTYQFEVTAILRAHGTGPAKGAAITVCTTAGQEVGEELVLFLGSKQKNGYPVRFAATPKELEKIRKLLKWEAQADKKYDGKDKEQRLATAFFHAHRLRPVLLAQAEGKAVVTAGQLKDEIADHLFATLGWALAEAGQKEATPEFKKLTKAFREVLSGAGGLPRHQMRRTRVAQFWGRQMNDATLRKKYKLTKLAIIDRAQLAAAQAAQRAAAEEVQRAQQAAAEAARKAREAMEAARRRAPAAPAPTPKPKPKVWYYTVAAGDSLGSVARKQLGDQERWKEIAELNNLDKPYMIRVGQKLKIPAKEAKPTAAEPPGTPKGKAALVAPKEGAVGENVNGLLLECRVGKATYNLFEDPNQTIDVTAAFRNTRKSPIRLNSYLLFPMLAVIQITDPAGKFSVQPDKSRLDSKEIPAMGAWSFKELEPGAAVEFTEKLPASLFPNGGKYGLSVAYENTYGKQFGINDAWTGKVVSGRVTVKIKTEADEQPTPEPEKKAASTHPTPSPAPDIPDDHALEF